MLRVGGEEMAKKADAERVEEKRRRSKKPETVMGELCEERLGKTGRGMEKKGKIKIGEIGDCW